MPCSFLLFPGSSMAISIRREATSTPSLSLFPREMLVVHTEKGSSNKSMVTDGRKQAWRGKGERQRYRKEISMHCPDESNRST